MSGENPSLYERLQEFTIAPQQGFTYREGMVFANPQVMPISEPPPLPPVKEEVKKSKDKIKQFDRVILTTERYGDNLDRPIWGKAMGKVVGLVCSRGGYNHIYWENGFEFNLYDDDIELYKGQKRDRIPGYFGDPTEEKFITINKDMHEELRLLSCSDYHSGGIFFGCGSIKDKIHINSIIKIPRQGGCVDLNGMNPEEQDMTLEAIKGAGLKYVACIILRNQIPPSTGKQVSLFLANYIKDKMDIPLVCITPTITLGWIKVSGEVKRFMV